MNSMLQASGLALAVTLAAGIVPALAQERDGRFHGREASAHPAGPQEPRPAPPSPRPVQAAPVEGPRGPTPQARGNWQGRGPDQRGWQQGQGGVDRGAQLRARAQAAGRERDQVQWQGRSRPPEQNFRGQRPNGQYSDEQRAQWQRDRAAQVQGDRSRFDRDRYDRDRYDRDRYAGDRDNRDRYGRPGQYRPDQVRGDQARRDWRNDGHRDWNRGWHGDRRYDWNGYRARNRDAFRLGSYYAPYRGYSYRRLGIGFSLQPLFFGSSYWIGDPFEYRLPPAYGPYRWVRYYDDALLVNIYTGEVVDTVYDIFW